MERAHHTHSTSSSVEHPNLTRSSRWSCDIYGGTADALIAAGLITREQLKPQRGRQSGVTAFLPDGEPCPPPLRAWRDPGYKVIRHQDDGTYRVEVTVAKEIQMCRRRVEKAANHEVEQARINKEVAEEGYKYRNWALKQDIHSHVEIWEGTKAQLQAAGLGVGLAFPGEPGARKKLECKCPLGFDFLIRLPDYDRARREARIYTAYSWFDPRGEQPDEFEAHAPGVLRKLWTPENYGTGSDTYEGTGDALVAAGLVPDARYFPGRPGVTKLQASYVKGWRLTTSATSTGEKLVATIRKCGNSGRFSVEVPAPEHEIGRRKALSEAREKERVANELRLSAERKLLRQGATPGKNAVEFRAERAELAKAVMDLLWVQVFARAEGGLSFDIPKDCELWEDLAEAFQTIRDAVQEADILRDKKQAMAAQTRLKLVAARNDKGLQSVLQSAKGLRLVHSADDEAQE